MLTVVQAILEEKYVAFNRMLQMANNKLTGYNNPKQ